MFGSAWKITFNSIGGVYTKAIKNFVEKVGRLARELEREIATVPEAREMLGLK